MLVGKTGHGPSCRQDDINTLMVNFAKGGKHVVRLKGGDPMIFGRAGEEIAASAVIEYPSGNGSASSRIGDSAELWPFASNG